MRNLPPLKRFGQNFLIDRNIIGKIISAVDVTQDDDVLEIGPGRGSLTIELVKASHSLVAIEIDRGLCRHLEFLCASYKRATIICQDILKFEMKKYAKDNKINTFKVVANLPYYITTPVIEYLFNNIGFINDIFIMVQKEVAARMTAKEGTKIYGSFSCFVNYYSEPSVLFPIKGNSFYPVPKIDSCFIRLKPYKNPIQHHGVKSEQTLFKVMRSGFGQRRKRLMSSLSSFISRDILAKLGCGKLLDNRPEQLSLSDFVRLSNDIFDGSISLTINPERSRMG